MRVDNGWYTLHVVDVDGRTAVRTYRLANLLEVFVEPSSILREPEPFYAPLLPLRATLLLCLGVFTAMVLNSVVEAKN